MSEDSPDLGLDLGPHTLAVHAPVTMMLTTALSVEQQRSAGTSGLYREQPRAEAPRDHFLWSSFKCRPSIDVGDLSPKAEEAMGVMSR